MGVQRVVVVGQGRVLADDTVQAVRDMVGVRRVSFAAPAVPDLPGILRSSVEGGRVHLLTTDSDLLVTELVRAGTAFADLQVRPTSLEEAFITITSKEETRV